MTATRFLDIVLSFLMIISLLPLFILIIVLIFLDDGLPIFFFQRRLGLSGNTFRLVKFRSMIKGASKMEQGYFSSPKDPRLLRIGLFIRKWSIDELPQLFNVLLGDMSLVGPRPPVEDELDNEELPIGYKKRFNIKPGLTGLSQVSGRNDLSWEEKIRYDLILVDDMKTDPLKTYFNILIKTIPVVVLRKGSIEK